MLSYYLKCRKKKESKNPRVVKTNKGKRMLLPKSAVCGSKKARFIKEQEANRLLNSLGIRTPLSQLPVVGSYIN